MNARSRDVSDSELAVLKVLWEQGPGTVREVLAALQDLGREWAYTTVLTLLQRLRDKGLVDRDSKGKAHVYSAAVSRDAVLRDRLGELADRLCDGEASPLVHALVDKGGLSKQEYARLRELLDRLERKKTDPPKRSGKRRKPRHG